MNLFQCGQFTLHSGFHTNFKIDCDALTKGDWASLAYYIVCNFSPFRSVEGVPTGGLSLAEALAPYHTEAQHHPLLIVDDVLTTGASMEEQRAGRDALGIVVFARGKCPDWVKPMFQMAVN